ncbi:M48 family metallopeptidase [Chitiniphilus eburneus]|uniref:M48 family metallopeptidase n=1 Tax=Chitiniphilus eburneus TaxID=2571148 RepID=A0A4V5MS78_9NEIS|nr:SprT family zinc-dependent metalloprotease [Chitiniphilus eburneus]TJZ79048.1 M48 family metallopeptidase [Chitiniphilus eburneus]
MSAATHRLELAERTLEYTITRSSRRSIGLRIDARGLVVQLPTRAPLAEAERVLRLKLDWVLKHLQARPSVALAPALAEGDCVSWLGAPRMLQLGATRARLTDDSLWLSTPDAARLPVALTQFLQRSARGYFAERVQTWSGRMGLTPRRLLLTSARGRWGSCSATGDIRLNWRLMQAPAEVIDYVVIHELAHLAELNHSPRFWALVERVCPDWRRQRGWLKAHGGELFRF